MRRGKSPSSVSGLITIQPRRPPPYHIMFVDLPFEQIPAFWVLR
ncbi:hypothetical protein [Mycolicibacterium brisbanense]|nr:hypothetical protein [Mycolicibacterium brisbanense]